MINTESINNFVTSLPEASIEVEEILSLKMRLAEAVSPATASLAQRGYLGCLPFAHRQGDEFVLRLLPGKNLTNSPVAVAWWSETEGLTIAPDIGRFIAGAMAYTDVAGSFISEDDRDYLLEFASEFGDISTSSTEAVISALDEAESLQDSRDRKAILWGTMGPNEPMCQIIKTAWQLAQKDAAEWAEKAIHENPELEIPWRIYTSYHVIYETGVDLTEAAWRLITSNDVFDATYTGYSRGPTKGTWTGRPIVDAVKWLQRQGNCEVKIYPALWKAAQAFAEDPENYDGSEHLVAAQKIASENPVLAYTCLANAAAYYAHATEQTPIRAIVFAHELAVANGWQELQILLSWARTEMNI
jgi:hypothetical protein